MMSYFAGAKRDTLMDAHIFPRRHPRLCLHVRDNWAKSGAFLGCSCKTFERVGASISLLLLTWRMSRFLLDPVPQTQSDYSREATLATRQIEFGQSSTASLRRMCKNQSQTLPHSLRALPSVSAAIQSTKSARALRKSTSWIL